MNDKMKCPHCHQMIDVEEVLKAQIENRYRQDFEKQLAQKNALFAEERKRLDMLRDQLAAEKEAQDQKLQAEVKKLLDLEREKAGKEAREAVDATLRTLMAENTRITTEFNVFKAKEVAMLMKENELKQKQESMELEMNKLMLQKQQEIETVARQRERESFELEKAALLKQIDDNKKLAEEMKRRAEQGSMQLQGEVQEIVLENLLRTIYPFDQISEVPKGIRGADAIQTVVNNRQQVCGTIVYESKNTKAFSAEWITKLKQDQLACKADLAVIVTQAMPAGMERFGEVDGVWICGFREVKSLSFALREMLIRIQAVKQTETNKGDKAELLYRYFTGNEFVQNIQRIMEIYNDMEQQVSKEKKAFAKIWAEREKQIWGMQENMARLFGSISGITGKELSGSDFLELAPESEN
jgi:hypothetical protein